MRSFILGLVFLRGFDVHGVHGPDTCGMLQYMKGGTEPWQKLVSRLHAVLSRSGSVWNMWLVPRQKPVVKWCMVKMAADGTPVGVLHVIMSPPRTNAGVLGVRRLTLAMWGRLGHILRGWTRRQLKIHLWYRHTPGMGMRQMALKVWQVFSISPSGQPLNHSWQGSATQDLIIGAASDHCGTSYVPRTTPCHFPLGRHLLLGRCRSLQAQCHGWITWWRSGWSILAQGIAHHLFNGWQSWADRWNEWPGLSWLHILWAEDQLWSLAQRPLALSSLWTQATVACICGQMEAAIPAIAVKQMRHSQRLW